MHDDESPVGRDVARDVARELQQPVRFGADLDARVMAAVRALPPHERISAWLRMIAPRTITLRPLPWSVAAAAVLATVAVLTPQPRVVREWLADAASAAPGGRAVQFVLVAPDARKVSVVGDFNDWDVRHAALVARHQGGGVWSVTARIPDGHHRYSFVVDDSVWRTDPAAPSVADADYGVPVSALVVGR